MIAQPGEVWVRLSRLDCLEQTSYAVRLGRVDQSDAGQWKQV